MCVVISIDMEAIVGFYFHFVGVHRCYCCLKKYVKVYEEVIRKVDMILVLF